MFLCFFSISQNSNLISNFIYFFWLNIFFPCFFPQVKLTFLFFFL